MASEWFYSDGNDQTGPVTSARIKSLAQSGVITPQTLVRRDNSEWMKASRIKGLFDQAAEPENTTDPLLAMGSQAAASMASAAGTAATAVAGWFAKKEEAPKREPVKSSWLDGLALDDQTPDVVAKVAEKLSGILMSGETVVYIAVQAKPIVNWMPDCIALTNKRFIFYRPKMLGRVDFEDYVWRDLEDAKLSENMIGATFSIRTRTGTNLSMDYLPKTQAKAIYRFAQEQEESALEDRRNRSLEEKRATAGGVVVHTAPAAQQANKDDPVESLKKLKNMVDAGLISQAEFDTKKAEILSRM